jgi:structural maintenance of chromosome 1
VHGRLVELVSPSSKRYNLAVTVALGKHLDAVVVDTEATAFAAVAWLRSQKVRPMTFIPLDTIAAKEAPDAVTAFLSSGAGKRSERYRLAKDVLRYEPELGPAVLYATGATVIADTLDDARWMRFDRRVEAKVVSLDGSVVAKNGNMTGGASSADRDLAQAGRWDEKTVSAAKARRDALLAEEELLRRRTGRARGSAGGGAGAGGDATSLVTQVEDLTSSLATNASRVKVVGDDLERTRKRIADLEAEAATADKNVGAATASLDEVTARMTGRAGEMGDLDAKIAALADAVFAPFAARLGLAGPGAVRAWEAAVVGAQEAEMKARRSVSDALTKLRTKLDYAQR